eukprot:51531-Eustigmatos_ZCMA.PRE.1
MPCHTSKESRAASILVGKASACTLVRFSCRSSTLSPMIMMELAEAPPMRTMPHEEMTVVGETSTEYVH